MRIISGIYSFISFFCFVTKTLLIQKKINKYKKILIRNKTNLDEFFVIYKYNWLNIKLYRFILRKDLLIIFFEKIIQFCSEIFLSFNLR
jgi:hypothetical protein